MKRFLIATSCLALLLPSLSLAQAGPGSRPETRPAPSQANRPGAGGPGAGRPGGGDVGRPGAGRPGGGKPPGDGGGAPGGGSRPGGGGGGNRPSPGGGHRPSPGAPPPSRPGGQRPGVGIGRPGHFTYLGRSRPRFHAGLFRYPPGFGYRRWSYGQTLPLAFLTSAYFFSSYAALGLDPPPYGYQWVRYGPDLLLVQLSTGRIVDVVDGAVY